MYKHVTQPRKSETQAVWGLCKDNRQEEAAKHFNVVCV